MEHITKVQQKYKGTRRIERRPLTSKKGPTSYPENYVHRKKVDDFINTWREGCKVHGELIRYRLIYQ